MRSARRPVVAVCAIAVVCASVLVACSNEGAGSSSTGGSPDGRDIGPLDEFFGFGKTDTPFYSQEDLARMGEVGRKTAECMKAEGFTYVPPEPESLQPGRSIPHPDDREWVAQFGYTQSTFDEFVGIDASKKTRDPNVEAVSKLSESEKKAYFEANEMCETEAEKQIPPLAERSSYDKSDFEGIRSDIEIVRRRVEQDPRIGAAAEKWAVCMSDAGYVGLAKPDDGLTQIRNQLSKLTSVKQEPSPSASGTPGVQWTAASGTAGFQMTGGVSPPDPHEPKGTLPQAKSQDELKKLEIAVALADFDCQRSSGYHDTFKQVRHELEQDFVNKHREELERYRDAQGWGDK